MRVWERSASTAASLPRSSASTAASCGRGAVPSPAAASCPLASANATFNSTLDYELAVLKPIAEPLLMEVKPFEREYAEALAYIRDLAAARTPDHAQLQLLFL